MREMKMKIAVSACLLGENCKYNGGNNKNEKLLEFLKEHEVIPVCPEVAGELPIPRAASEIVNGVVMNNKGENVDEQFRSGAKKCLDKVISENAELVILQSRSPSCGVKQIYDGTFSGRKIEGQGVFANLLMENGIQTMDIEDL